MTEMTAISQTRGEKAFVPPFYVVIDHEQSVSDHPSVAEARAAGQKACDAELLPCHLSIQDAEGEHVKDISRSDLVSLQDGVGRFHALQADTGVGRCR